MEAVLFHQAELRNTGNDSLRFALADARFSCRIAAEEVRRFPPAVEPKFLAVGAMLQEILGASRSVSSAAAALETELAAAGIEMALAELDRAVATVAEAARDSEQRFTETLEGISRVSALLGAASGMIEAFQDRVKALDALRVYSRIQAASLDGGETFLHISDEIGRLSTLVRNKWSEILRILATQRKVLDSSISSLDLGTVTGTCEAAAAAKAVAEGVASLETFFRGKDTVVTAAVRKSSTVTAEVDEIMAGLQFHDIARQKFEHVAASLTEGTMEDAAVSPAAILHQVVLQLAHLVQSEKEFRSATSEVAARVRQVREVAASFISGSDNLLSAEGWSTEAVAHVRHGVRSLDLLLERHRHTSAAVGAMAAIAAELTASLKVHVAETEEVAADIALVSLNAVIRAARGGESSAPLGIISEAIRNTAAAIGEDATAIATALGEAGARASLLVACRDPEEQQVDMASLFRHVERLERAEARLAVEVEGARNRVAELVAGLETVANTIDLTRELDRLRDRVVPLLTKVRDQIAPYSDERTEPTREELMAGVLSRYTMESERIIHHSVMAGGGADDAMGGEENDNVFLF